MFKPFALLLGILLGTAHAGSYRKTDGLIIDPMKTIFGGLHTYTGNIVPHANLQGADLQHADLQGANLRGADLQNANLLGANLQGADLQGANLTDAILMMDADLRGANLQGADLQGADLTDAQFDVVKCGSGTRLEYRDDQATCEKVEVTHQQLRSVMNDKSCTTIANES